MNYSNSQSIKSWAEEDRPREKMLLKGKNALSDAELLAILIGTGSGKQTAVDLARNCLQLTQGDLNAFGKISFSDLTAVKGIGASKAISILAALELGRRRKEEPQQKRLRIDNVQKAYNIFKPYFQDLEHEEFYLMLLNRNNEVIAVKQVSKGGIAGTVVDGKIVFKTAIDAKASYLILAHNHPSGNIQPSLQDKNITKKMVEFGKLIELEVIDHLIVTDNSYFSFANNNMI